MFLKIKPILILLLLFINDTHGASNLNIVKPVSQKAITCGTSTNHLTNHLEEEGDPQRKEC